MKSKSVTKKLENGERTPKRPPDGQTKKKLMADIIKPIPGKDKPEKRKPRGAKSVNRYAKD